MEKHNLEFAQNEAQKMKKKVALGEAADFDEAESLVEKEKEKKVWEDKMREFLNKDISEDAPDWLINKTKRIKNRFESGRPDTFYLRDFLRTLEQSHPPKEQVDIVEMVLMYELESFDNVEDEKFKQLLMRSALHVSLNKEGYLESGKESDIAKTVKTFIDSRDLQEIYELVVLKGPSKIKNRDLSNIAETALEKGGSGDELSEKIIERVKQDVEKLYLFRNNLEGFSTSLVSRVVEKILEQNPNFYDEELGFIYDDYMKTDKLSYRVEHAFRMFPALKKAFEMYDIRVKEEKQKKENNEKEKIKEIIDARTNEANKETDEKIKSIENAQILSAISLEDSLKSPDNWEIIKTTSGIYSKSDLQRSFFSESVFADDDKSDKLEKAKKILVSLLERKIEDIEIPNFETVVSYVLGNNKIGAGADFEEYQIVTLNLNDVLEKIKNTISKSKLEEHKKFLEKVYQEIIQTYNQYKESCDEKLFAMEENERIEQVNDLKKEFLFKQVELKIEYLKKLYEYNLGINLEEINGRASEDMGTSVGSVSFGRGQSLRQEMRQINTQSIHFGIEDYIELEMGSDLETLEKRLEMVNWVAPHEIAHMVDMAHGEKLSEAKKEDIELVGKISEKYFYKKDVEIIKSVLEARLSEAVIDGIGFQMAKKFGVSDPFVKEENKKIESMAQGFVAAVDVLDYISKNNIDDETAKIKVAIVNTTMLASAENILKELNENESSQDIIKSLENAIEKLNTIIDSFEIEGLGSEAKNSIKKLMDKYMEIGKTSVLR